MGSLIKLGCRRPKVLIGHWPCLAIGRQKLRTKSMRKIEYRNLRREEINKLSQIDRTEIIKDVYYMRGGALVLEKEHHDVAEWGEAEKQGRIEGLQKIFILSCN